MKKKTKKAAAVKARELPVYPEHLFTEEGHYPSDECLEFIKKFDVIKYGVRTLVDFIERVWWMPSWGFQLSDGVDDIFNEPCKKLELHTGGWSGNESIMYALEENVIFWTVSWTQTRRGGHYYFDIKELK